MDFSSHCIGRAVGWLDGGTKAEIGKALRHFPLFCLSLSHLTCCKQHSLIFLESKVICFHRIGGGTFTATEFVEKKCLSHILNKPKLFQPKASFKPCEFICVLVNIGEWQSYSQQETRTGCFFSYPRRLVTTLVFKYRSTGPRDLGGKGVWSCQCHCQCNKILENEQNMLEKA